MTDLVQQMNTNLQIETIMEGRPKIKLDLSSTDIVLELMGWIAVLAIWGLIISSYSHLPDTIPTHFNGSGKADGFGSKANILALPIISTVIFIGLTILNKFPQVFNYPTNITKENANQQYTNATRLVRYLKLAVVVIFGLIVYKTIQSTHGQSDGLGIWFLPFTLGAIFIPLTYFAIKSFKIKK